MLRVRIRSHDVHDALMRRISSRALRPLAERAVREALDVLADEVRSRAPVDTGALRDSIAIETWVARDRSVRGRVVVGGNGFDGSTYYAFFIEFGTARMSARPFLRPAVDAAGRKVETRMRRRLMRGLGRA